MSSSLMNLNVEQLTALLKEKTDLYNDMINQNKEFQEVKGLFMEIKDIINLLSQLQESETLFTSRLSQSLRTQ